MRAQARDVCRRSDRAYTDCADRLIALPDWPVDHGVAFHRRLPSHPAAVTLARHAVTRWLRRQGIATEDVFDVGLALSEACANAVEHPQLLGRRAIEVTAEREETAIWLRVRDFGRWRDNSSPKERGRGLGLMRSVMDSVQISRSPTGTSVVMGRALVWPDRTRDVARPPAAPCGRTSWTGALAGARGPQREG